MSLPQLNANILSHAIKQYQPCALRIRTANYPQTRSIVLDRDRFGESSKSEDALEDTKAHNLVYKIKQTKMAREIERERLWKILAPKFRSTDDDEEITSLIDQLMHWKFGTGSSFFESAVHNSIHIK
mmetsp:Transcript_36507/g.46507  ORF Transcript_36507/g.46507 Transcript_36507/m.46507 type:complete len:127 (+) Transcript_36507:128-508(+)